MPNMVVTECGPTLLVVHNDKTPSNTEWEVAIDQTLRAAKRPGRSILVYTLGGGPSAAQRMRVSDRLGNVLGSIPTAVLSSNRLTMGIVTAMSWLRTGGSSTLRAFDRDDLTEAMDWLQTDTLHAAAIRRALERALAKVLKRVVDE